MIQFTKEERVELEERAKRQPKVIQRRKENVQEVMERPVMVPKTGIANWTLYYYCPKCSVQLEFDWEKEHSHRCPCCGGIYEKEPYDSAWWGLVNAKNYTAAHEMGLIYAATGEEAYAKKSVEILLAYATYYPNYQVHGDIPYNGPGRSGAQTLDEANFQRHLAMAYDLVEEIMTPQEKTYVRDRMFLPGAEFLKENRHNQLHNHEVIINSAIAIIGILFDRQDLIQFGIYETYGLLYQLEHGMLSSHMWFEGSFGYHFYALASFFDFEKFAIHTKHSHIHHPAYRAMMELLPPYLQPDGQMPMLNDTTYGHLNSGLYLYEFAYRHIKSDRMLWILQQLYGKQERENMEAFFYGEENLPESVEPVGENWKKENYHTEIGTYGHTILRGCDGRYLLIKHDTYGGEHDHYDRLGISYMAYGKPISVDMGTTGYGAVLHYDYYKNTGTHNTVVIGEENQSPASCRLIEYKKEKDIIYVTVECDWKATYEMPDSFTIVQWKKENYENVKMTRKIAWTDTFFAEAFYVIGAGEQLSVDWVMHFKGEREELNGKEIKEPFSTKKPFSYFHDVVQVNKDDKEISTTGKQGELTIDKSFSNNRIRTRLEDVTTDLYCADLGGERYVARGFDNPSAGELNHVIERRRGKDICFLHLVESYKNHSVIEQVEFANGKKGWEVCVRLKNGQEKCLDLSISK